MVIISKTIIREFGLKHADANDALNDWFATVSEANWSNFTDIKQTFNSVDYVGNERFVFNIKGNRYRLVTMIFLDIRTVFIRFIGTHAEYDKIDSTTI
ncbi:MULTISPECIES: type II toxin-antitoxin system HigB family toxin [Runella]|uniref:mRNA interferase HigB n=1 Tax=Runella defluvii TaxID=370973 RepID=A0A7W5ZP27_9BACT|nr:MULTISPECIES: type II toxin-antitoxin system HigB family toxin [Runella]AYQ34673.1 type II toxin-antitoxin system HigB family toxin [Runella sp. SP2]MBB3840428.1 mRNA interferase HigB [Runella defluvii]